MNMIGGKRGFMIAMLIVIFSAYLASAYSKDASVNQDSIKPSNIYINTGDSVRFVVKDSYGSMISCYNDLGRDVFRSENMMTGTTAEATFDRPGKYLCVEGSRGSKVIVHVTDFGDGFTGNAVINSEVMGQESPGILIGVIIILAAIVIFLRRNKDVKKNKSKKIQTTR